MRDLFVWYPLVLNHVAYVCAINIYFSNVCTSSRSSAKLPSVSLVATMDREKFKAAPAPVNLPSERGSSLANISVRALRTSDSEDMGPI